MATQPRTIESPAAPSAWRARYIFYHADQDRLLRHLLLPLLRELLAARVIERFFFVRYALGGPHIRLRWRLAAGAAESDAEAALRRHAQQFFAEFPSTESLPEEQIRSISRLLSASDPSSGDAGIVYGDNTVAPFPVQFETERYGGPDRLPDSLELFCISSAYVLRAMSSGQMRTTMLRTTLQLAWGLSSDDPEDFLSLAGYADRFMHGQFAPCMERARQYFVRKRDELIALADRELDNAYTTDFFTGAYQTGRGLALLSPEARWYAAASHIHMTANRLGVSNAEEVYLAGMLLLALQALRDQRPDRWQALWRARTDWVQSTRRRSLAETVEASIAALMEAPCQ